MEDEEAHEVDKLKLGAVDGVDALEVPKLKLEAVDGEDKSEGSKVEESAILVEAEVVGEIDVEIFAALLSPSGFTGQSLRLFLLCLC